jgi:hypothetical protein
MSNDESSKVVCLLWGFAQRLLPIGVALTLCAAGCGGQRSDDTEVELEPETVAGEESSGGNHVVPEGRTPADRTDVQQLLSPLKVKLEAREANLSIWEAELKDRQNRLSEAWTALGVPPKFDANPPLKEIEAKLVRVRTREPNTENTLTQEEDDSELSAIKMSIAALDSAENKLRVWDELLKEDEDRCIAAARALQTLDESSIKPAQPVRRPIEDDGTCLVTPLPNTQRDYRRLISSSLKGQMMSDPQRIPRGMSFPCTFAQTVNADKLTNGSRFYILLDSDSGSATGGFGPTHEFSDYPKGTYFEAEVVDVKEDVQGLKGGKGGAVFRIQRIVIPGTDKQGRASELCVDVAATMGKEAPSAGLFDTEAARTRYAGVAANAMQLLDNGTGFFNGQAAVEMTLRTWEHFVSKPEEKARSCFLFGTVAKGTPCKVDLLMDSWF